MNFSSRKIISFVFIATTALMCVSCQQPSGKDASKADASASENSVGGFFNKLGNSITEGVKNGVDNGIETSDSVGVLGYTLMPSKLARNTLQPAYCLDNPVTHKIITVAPMFGRPYRRADGTIGFAQTVKQVSQHTDKIEVNLNGVLPGKTCADLIKSRHLIPGFAPESYYRNGYISYY